MSKYIIKEPMPQYGKDTARIVYIPDEVVKRIRADVIEEFVHKVKEHHYVLHYVLSDVIKSTDYGMFTIGIEQIAEELKAGD